jgi:hypothetical protein
VDIYLNELVDDMHADDVVIYKLQIHLGMICYVR